jgi:hypothetical protein
MLKPLPKFSSDAAAEAFVAEADLSEYDLSGFKPIEFVFSRPTAGARKDKGPDPLLASSGR